MQADRSLEERVLGLLRPYASRWTGTLGRGDLVIPQREVPRLVHEILETLHGEATEREATDLELFEVLMESRRRESVQDQVAALRHRYRILAR